METNSHPEAAASNVKQGQYSPRKRKDTTPRVNPQLAVELVYQELKRVEVYTKRIEDALYLSARSHVTLIHRRAQLRATGRAVERAKANPNIEFCLGSPPERIEKSGAGLAVALANGVRIEADGVFIAVGTRPETALAAGQVALDEAGYILAGEDTHTNVPGVFAAGDTRVKDLRQLVTAAADGAAAAFQAGRYLQSLV